MQANMLEPCDQAQADIKNYSLRPSRPTPRRSSHRLRALAAPILAMLATLGVVSASCLPVIATRRSNSAQIQKRQSSNQQRPATGQSRATISGTLIMRATDPMKLEQFIERVPPRWRSALTIVRDSEQTSDTASYALVLLPQAKPKDEAKMLAALTNAANDFTSQGAGDSDPNIATSNDRLASDRSATPQRITFTLEHQIAVVTGFHCGDPIALATFAQKLLENPRYQQGAAAAGITTIEIGVEQGEQYHLRWITDLPVKEAGRARFFLGSISRILAPSSQLTTELKVEPYQFINHRHIPRSEANPAFSERLLPVTWWINWFGARAELLRQASAPSTSTASSTSTALSTTTAPSPLSNPQLAARLEQVISTSRQKGLLLATQKIGVAITDPLSGETIGENLHQPMQIASIAKLYIGALVMHQRAAGRITYTQDTARKMRLMLQKSDNRATNDLLKTLGGPQAAQSLLATHYPKLAQNVSITSYIPLPSGAEYNNTASPAAVGAIMATLWQGNKGQGDKGQGDKIPYSDEIIQMLAYPGLTRLAPPGADWLPATTQSANKTGSTNRAFNDTAILVWRGEDGGFRAVGVTVLIEGEPEINPATRLFDRRKNLEVMRRVGHVISAGAN